MAAIAVVSFACTVLIGPLWNRDPATSLFTLLLSVTLATAGLVLWPDAEHRLTAGLLIGAGLVYSLGWVEEWSHDGPYPIVAAVATPAAFSLAAWAMLRYPSPDLMQCCERSFLTALSVWLVGSQLAYDVTERPQQSSYSPHAWWVTLVELTPAQHQTLARVQHVGELVVAGCFLIVWVRRIRRVRGLDRQLLAPVALAAPMAAAGGAALPLAWLLRMPAPVVHDVYVLAPVLLAIVPASFLVTVVRARLSGLAVLTLLRQVQRTPTPQAVQEALREALRDPSLQVSYWAPPLAGYVDARGERATGPEADASPAGERLRLTVTTDDGEPLALIEAHPDLTRHAALVRQAVAAAGLALENAQLQAVVQAQVAQVNASQLRTVEAGLAERRRLERNLHDGAQQRLLALRLRLAAQDDRDWPAEVSEVLDGVRAELGHSLEELRELARGIYPAVLTRSGLAPAVNSAAEQHPIRVRSELPDRRFPAATEAVAYFVIRAALEHACGPAGAQAVTVRGRDQDGRLTIEVEDDGTGAGAMDGVEGIGTAGGVGGAGATASTGLTAAVNRLRALGGTIQLTPAPGGRGSRVVAEIPCG